MNRRLLFGACVGLALPFRGSAKKRKRHKKKPAPYASASVWSTDPVPRGVPVLCGAGTDWIGPVRAAVETWNSVQSWVRLELQEVPPLSTDALSHAGMIMIVAAQSDASWGGLTQVTPGENGIASARIIFDDTDYEGRYLWPKSTERERVAAHELGHALGLTHAPQGDKGCMAAGAGKQPRTHPSAWTLQQLALTYS